MIRARNKLRAVDANDAGAFEQRQQVEALQNCRAVAADEFAADAMARIVAGFENRGWDAALAQADAERESGKTAANDRDCSRSGHFWKLPSRFSRQENKSFAPCSTSTTSPRPSPPLRGGEGD